jgi:hypothetical protein
MAAAPPPDAGDDPDAQFRARQYRNAVVQDIALRYCSSRLSRGEAVNAVASLGRTFPVWWTRIRGDAHRHGRLLPGAPDRAVAAYYLRYKLDLMRAEAVRQKNGAAEAVVADRLAGLDPEAERPVTTARATRRGK